MDIACRWAWQLALFAWATVLTYERAAPQPDRFVAAGGATLMTSDDVIAEVSRQVRGLWEGRYGGFGKPIRA
jgi:nitric oxide reductase large subunit